MSKIYTKTGDGGTTGLLSGSRVSKSDQRLEAYGQIDHLNSMVGILIQHLDGKPVFKSDRDLLEKIQNKLFNIGSLLACPGKDRQKFNLKDIELKEVEILENSIDNMTEGLPKLVNFILPGGTLPAAHAHLCRTQTRNIERVMTSPQFKEEDIPKGCLIYVNRLSDYFFALARSINGKLNTEEIIWKG